MKQDFLATLIGNPNQARILRMFIFNDGERFTAKQIGKRTGVSAEAALEELDKLKAIHTLRSVNPPSPAGKKKEVTEPVWFLDTNFKHLKALTKFVRDISPMHYEEIVDALKRSGRLSAVVLSGSFMGDETRPADMLVAVDNLNEERLESAVRGLEPMFGREIRYAVFTTPEFRYRLTVQDKLLRDTFDYPHLVLLDRSRLL